MDEFANLLNESLSLLINIQNQFIEIIEETSAEEKQQKINQFLNSPEIGNFFTQSSNLYLFLQYLGHYIKFHHENNSFLDIINKIIHHFENQIKKILTQYQLYNIAIKSRLLLIILLEQHILDKKLLIQNLVRDRINKTTKMLLIQTLAPEFCEYKNSYLTEFQDPLVHEYYISGSIVSKEYEYQEEEEEEDINVNSTTIPTITEIEEYNTEEFIKNRRVGENPDGLCQYIRSDDIDLFCQLMTKLGTNLNKQIQMYIFDTNEYPSEPHKFPSLFEYSAYNGSYQIFKHFLLQNATHSNQLIFYSIHGGNNEIIHEIERNIQISIDYKEAFKYAIKCHQNYMAEYFLQNISDETVLTAGIIQSIESFNFSFLMRLFDDIKRSDYQKYDFFKKLIEFGYSNSVDKILSSAKFGLKIDAKLLMAPFENNDSLMFEILVKYFEFSNTYDEDCEEFIQNAINAVNPELFKTLLTQKKLQEYAKSVYIYIFNSFYI